MPRSPVLLALILTTALLSACGGGKGAGNGAGNGAGEGAGVSALPADKPDTSSGSGTTIDTGTAGTGTSGTGSGDTGADDTGTGGTGTGGTGTDGTGTDSTAEPGPQPTALDQALASGDVRLLAGTEPLAALALASITAATESDANLHQQLFEGVSALSWNPTHDAAQLRGEFGVNSEVLRVNADQDGNPVDADAALAIAGHKGASRYLVFGGHPLRNLKSDASLLNAGMLQFLRNSVTWLSAGKATDLKVVLAQHDESYWFPDDSATRTWLSQEFGDNLSINAANQCDGAALKGCLQAGADLLIISQSDNGQALAGVMDGIHYALAHGVPVLYLHHDGGLTDLGQAMFNEFSVTYRADNYWDKYTIQQATAADAAALPDSIQAMEALLTHLRDGDFSFSVAQCDEGCANTPAFAAEFGRGASAVKDIFEAYDRRNFALFAQEGYRLQKLLVLLADQLRQWVRYPMSRGDGDTTGFLQAYFADHLHYVSRAVNPVPPDLGNFSRTDFSHVNAVSKTVQLTSKQSFRAAGVYALPGQTVRVTRLDSQPVKTAVRVNSLRAGATHEWDANGYNRPKFLNSADLALATGETVEFTSAYGGPIHVTFSANDIGVQLRFEHVGEHPFWASNADSARFTEALAVGDFDWAELVTDSFEVHSTLGKMRESASDPRWSDASAMAQAAMTYDHNYPLLLAGFQGPGIETVAEIHQWAQNQGLSVYSVDQVKHMNADQASCGYGCSGNPYDAYWAFDPTGHGDIHEIGHGLEKSRFRFPGWEVHTTTNPYSYYSKSRYHLNTGAAPQCQSLPFAELYQKLESAQASPDPVAYMAGQNLGTWNYGVAVYIQMMMAAQHYGTLQNGWHLWARLHILEREFSKATGSDSTWQAKRDALGFGQYARPEAKAISNTDFMLVALSQAAGVDYRALFALYGLQPSATAASQVSSLSLALVPKVFFDADKDNFCLGLDRPVRQIW